MAWTIDGLGSAASLTPLPGGWSGRTLSAVGLDGTRCVVRVYPPDQAGPAMAPEVEAAVLRLVRGLVPVPQVLEVRRTTTTQPGLLLMSQLPGERGDLVLADCDEAAAAALGRGLGELAARLAAMPMLDRGLFSTASLQIERFDAMDISDWIDTHSPALMDSAGWTLDAVRALRAVGERAQDLLDTVDRTCLVHSDLNPKNVLIDPDTLVVTGLVDWEYAHAGHPATDLGNVVRFVRRASYVDAAVVAYQETHQLSRERLLDLARAADLMALVELAARSAASPEGSPARLAETLLATIAAQGDLHAWPASWTLEAPRA